MTQLSKEDILKNNNTSDPNSITSLSLHHKALTSVSCLGDFKNLERLDLSFNSLTSLKGLESCLNLKWLSVQKNKLQSLKGVEALTNLTVLNAGTNKLKSMDEVKNLVKLRALILNDNEIASISGLDPLKELNTLVLSRNPIRKMGNSLAKLKSIAKISLSNCQLEAIDPSVKACTELEQLRLAHNDIKTIPAELGYNKKLQILDLGNNVISKWSDLEALSALHNLKNFNLLGNPIAEKAKLLKKIKKLVPNLQIFNAKRIDQLNKIETDKKNGDAAFGAMDDSNQEKKRKKADRETFMNDGAIPESTKYMDSDEHFGKIEANKSRELAKGGDHVDATSNKLEKPNVDPITKKHKKSEIHQVRGEELVEGRNEMKRQKKKKEKHAEKEVHVQDFDKATEKRSKRKAEKADIDVIDDNETPFAELFTDDAQENMKSNEGKGKDDKAVGSIDSISALVTFPAKRKKAKNQGPRGASVFQSLTPAPEVGLGGLSTWDD